MKVRGVIDADAARKLLAYKALSTLTKTQEQRYIMQKKHGLSIHAIAIEEKTTPQAVAKKHPSSREKNCKFYEQKHAKKCRKIICNETVT